MDGERHKHPGKRELTYRVGWKKGKFEVGENGQVSAAASTVAFREKNRWHRLLESGFFCRAPVVPVSGLAVMLYVLPVVLFGLTWWLTYLLSSVW